jgi:hypothetical protein
LLIRIQQIGLDSDASGPELRPADAGLKVC